MKKKKEKGKTDSMPKCGMHRPVNMPVTCMKSGIRHKV